MLTIEIPGEERFELHLPNEVVFPWFTLRLLAEVAVRSSQRVEMTGLRAQILSLEGKGSVRVPSADIMGRHPSALMVSGSIQVSSDGGLSHYDHLWVSGEADFATGSRFLDPEVLPKAEAPSFGAGARPSTPSVDLVRRKGR